MPSTPSDAVPTRRSQTPTRRTKDAPMTHLSISGDRPVGRCDDLGAAPFSESAEFLERTYLTPSHRHALDAMRGWMVEAGMSVRLDPLGNLVGRYEGEAPGAKALMIGSHLD